MKLLALLALVGFAAATTELKWDSGKEYTFDYRGRMITGMPDLARQYSGIGIKAKVVVMAKQPHLLALMVREPEFVTINDILKADPERSVDNDNWRNLELPTMHSVPEPQKRMLLLPVQFRLEPSTGAVVEVIVSHEEAEWSINFKKALITLFQTKLQSETFEVEENTVGAQMSEPYNYWKVKEQSLDGECECTYQVNEIPEYVVLDNPMDLFPKMEACTGGKFFEIVRVRDLDSCSKRATYNFYKPGYYKCQGGEKGGNCGMMWSRTSTTKWYVCGPPSALRVQSIVNDGEMNQQVMGYNTEKMVTGTLQILKLKEIRPTSDFPAPPQPLTIRTLMYEFTKKTATVNPLEGESTDVLGLSPEERIKIQSEGRIPRSLLSSELVGKTLPRNSFQAANKDIDPTDIVRQCTVQIEEVASILRKMEDVSLPSKEVNMKVLSAARGISMLNKDQIHGIVKKLYDSSVEPQARSIFVDTVIMAGTKDAYSALKVMTTEGKLNRQQLYSLFLWLPHYLLTPTKGTLSIIKDFVMMKEVQEHKELRHIAVTSYTQLLQLACLKENRKDSYPTNVYGEFCHPDSEVVQSDWIPYLSKKLSETQSPSEKNIYIVALGLMNHKNVISHLLPVVEKTTPGVSELNRMMAVYSLANAGSTDPNLVIPIFVSLFTNPAESTEIRIVAFNSLMKLNPSSAVFQMIASITRTEAKMDLELLKTINLGLYTIGYNTEYQPDDVYYSSLASKARAAYSMVKKTPGILPTSAAIYGKSTMWKLNLSIESFLYWVSSESSFLPETMYAEVEQVIGQYHMYALKAGLRMKGIQDLFSKVSKKMLREQGGLPLEEQIKNTLSSKWNEIIEKLQLKVREDKTVDTGFFLRVFESAPIFLNVDSLSDTMSEKVMEYLKNPRLLSEGTYDNLYFQHVVDVSPIETTVPSDMGFPINTEFHSPVTVFLGGKLKTSLEMNMPIIEFEGHVTYTSQPVAWVGTVCPFTDQIVLTGVKQNTGIQIPAKINLKVDIPKNEVKVGLKSVQVSEKVNVAFFHVLPFTVTKKIDDIRPTTQILDTLKPIKSNTEEKNYGLTFGDYFGLQFHSLLKTESRFTDLKYVSDLFSLYHSCPLNYINFGWTLPAMDVKRQPSLRKHELNIYFKPTESSTKEIHMHLKFGCATKQVGEELRYHSLELLEEGEPLSYEQYQMAETPLKHGIPLLRKVLPYRVISKPFGEMPEHQKRQEKLKLVLEPLKLESGTAVTMALDVLLKGSRTVGYHYTLSSAIGTSMEGTEEGQIKQRWNVQLENPISEEAKLLCIKGDLTLPTLPVWNINKLENAVMKVKLENTIGYGHSSCEESKIVTLGHGEVSSEQHKFSRESPEKKKCLQLIEERVPGAKLSPICKKVLIQASTIDRVVLRTKFNNVSTYVKTLENKLISYIRMYLWPYTSPLTSMSVLMPESELSIPEIEEQRRLGQGQGLEESYETVTKILFKPRTPSFDLIIEKPGRSVKFVDVSIRQPFSLFYPMSVTHNNVNLITQRVVGQVAPPTCKVDGRKSVITFDNKTIPFRPSSCAYLLAGDCSSSHIFGITIHPLSTSEESVHELEVLLGKDKIKLVPSANQEFSEIKVKVNGQELPIPKGKLVPIVSQLQQRRRTIATLFRSTDNVLTLKAPEFYLPELKTDGRHVEVVPSIAMKKKMCGICGDFNMQLKADIPGPEKCIYSKSELEVASYRIPSQSCPPLPQRIEEELKRETEQCARFKVQPTKLTKSFKKAAGKCVVAKHVTIQRPGQVCISKIPVIQCGPSCKAVSEEKVVRTVPFTCLKQGRLAEHYLMKIKEGKPLSELRGTPTSFTSVLPQPRHCVHSILVAGERSI